MIPVKQTKLKHTHNNGNCMAAVVASIMEMKIEDVPNVEELMAMPDSFWMEVLIKWLEFKGWDWGTLTTIIPDEPYLAIGPAARGVNHVCIYKNGELLWDPHPSNTGLISVTHLEYLKKNL